VLAHHAGPLPLVPRSLCAARPVTLPWDGSRAYETRDRQRLRQLANVDGSPGVPRLLHDVALGYLAKRFRHTSARCGPCCPSCSQARPARTCNKRNTSRDRNEKLIIPLPGHPVKMSDLRRSRPPENANRPRDAQKQWRLTVMPLPDAGTAGGNCGGVDGGDPPGRARRRCQASPAHPVRAALRGPRWSASLVRVARARVPYRYDRPARGKRILRAGARSGIRQPQPPGCGAGAIPSDDAQPAARRQAPAARARNGRPVPGVITQHPRNRRVGAFTPAPARQKARA
jgi:hypothetical protein